MEKHLNSEQLALYAEYLAQNKLNQIAKQITEHVQNCDKCASEAIELSFLIEKLPIANNKIKQKTAFFNYKYLSIAASFILLFALWFYNTNLKNKKNTAQITPESIIIDSSSKKINIDTVHSNSINKNTIITEKKRKEKKKTIVLACYTPNMEFEKIVP